MKLPPVPPLEENYLCKNREEFAELLKRTISKSSGGAFFKVLGKIEGVPYYATMLIDNQKILAVEVQDIGGGGTFVGKPALELLEEMIEAGPVIVDAFPLDDADVKMSIIDNINIYNSTPKMHLSELCPAFGGGTLSRRGKPETPKTETVQSTTFVEEPKPKPKSKPKTEFALDVPAQLEPYFRAFGNRLTKYAKSIGVEPLKVKITAKEVRYALGAGKGIHTTVELEGSSKSLLAPARIKETLESFVYREAGELSKELNEKVVVSKFSLKL